MVERTGTFGGRGASSLKEAIARREKATYKRAKVNEYEYMDGMAESLNKEIKANVDPYWRNHASLKGKKFSPYLCPYRDNGSFSHHQV